jgi:rhodanese-related sulfurtransferase
MPLQVDRYQLQELLGQRIQLVDVLPRDEYEEEHLPGAVNLPLRRVETEVTTKLDPSRPLVVYCWDSA